MELYRRAVTRWLVRLAAPWLGVSGAFAHDLWIVPPEASSAEIVPDQRVAVRMRIGHGGQSEPMLRDGRRLVRFAAVRLGASVEREEPVVGVDGADPAGFFRPSEAGLWAIVYESRPAYSELAAEPFRGYLEEEGLDAVVELRRRRGQDGEPGRELYSRSLKSLVRVGGGHAADRPLGLPLEIVAETAPERWGREPTMLRLLRDGEPVAGALVDVQRLDGADAVTAERTDRQGRVRFDLGPGAWMAAVVYMEPDEDSPRADWRSIFSTLTWVIPER